MLHSNLVYYRKKKKMTQEQVAKHLGMSRPGYTAYEKGTRTPDSATQYKLADLYGVTLDELHGREPKKDFFHQADVLMFKDKEGWDKLSYEEQQRIMKELSDLADFYIAKENKGKE